MYFKKMLKKNDELLKKEILYDFMVLEKYHKTSRGESRQISLHCKFDFSEDAEKYYNEEFFVYLNVDEVTEDINDFVSRYGFKKTDDFPDNLKHLLGNYGMTIRAIDGFIP